MARKPRPVEPAKRAPAPPKKESEPRRMSGAGAADYLKLLNEIDDSDFTTFDDPGVDATVSEWIPTGSLAIDRLVGGGWPVGRITEIAAWEGVGKSTLLDMSFASAQRIGGIAAVVDTEKARDTLYTRSLGVDTGSLLAPNLGDDVTIEGVFNAIDNLCDVQAKIAVSMKKGVPAPPMLIGWDSVAGCPTRAERDKGSDAKHVMAAARMIKMNLRRITARLPKLRIALVFTNHFYESPQALAHGPTLKTYGGSGIRYFASIRLWLSRIGQLKAGDLDVGHIIEAKLKKTRVNKPRPPAVVGLVYGAGLDNSHTLYEWGKTHGAKDVPDHTWIRMKGSWSYLMLPDGAHEAFQTGFRGLGHYLSEHPALYQQMAEQYLAEG
jgi:recombination protein RecA